MTGLPDQLRATSGARYDILERLGSGAHGEGYLAQRLSDGHRVFLKVLKSELSADGEWAKRFCDEVALLRACVHPNIVRYVEAFRQESGELCLVTEYLEGEDLKARLRKSGPLPPKHVLSLALPLCNALEFLHGRDVIHRDLTPENIFVSGRFPDVVPRLLDFGLAWSAGPRQAKTGAALALTPLYAAPECLGGARATAASDIYSLGVILFEALSGAPPYAANSVEALLERQRQGDLPSLPERAAALQPVLRRCLAARPEDRWASTGELARALQSAVDSTPTGDRGEPKSKPTAAPKSLGTVGNYELVRELGKGGMGEVFLARHLRLGRQVAIKMLHADAMRDRDAVARFFNEARTVNAINHEHIVEIFDFVEEDGPNPRTYCVMELLVGASLAQVRKKSPLPIKRLLHICRQVADALAAAHRAGVVHRDIKPANIFVTNRSGVADFVKVLDFGVAKVNSPLPGGEDTPSINTQTGLSLGTPDYMSPEQVTAAPVDGRTDIFALGVMLYELLAGFRPFVGANQAHLVVMVVREPHRPLPPVSAGGEAIPPALARLVDRCLEKKREDRPQSMEEVSAALEKILHDLPARPVTETVVVAPPTVTQVQAPAPAATTTMRSPPAEPATEAQPSNLSALATAVTPVRGRKVWPIALGAVLLVGAGAAITLSTRGGSAPAVVTPPAPIVATPPPVVSPPVAVSAAPVVPPAAPVAPEKKAPTHVSLDVRSSPAGAAVLRVDTGEHLGTTPYTGKLPLGEEKVTLRLELEGHAPKLTEVSPSQDVSVDLSLSRLASKRPAPVRKAPVGKKKPRSEDPDAPLDPFAAP